MINHHAKGKYFVRLVRFILLAGIAGLFFYLKFSRLKIFFIPLILPVVTQIEYYLEVPIRTSGDYTEEEILKILIEWVHNKHPKKFYDYLFEKNNQKKREGATSLLWLRLSEEPSWIGLLPGQLLEQIGVNVDKNFIPDAKIDSLAKAVHSNQVRMFDLNSFLDEISKY